MREVATVSLRRRRRAPGQRGQETLQMIFVASLVLVPLLVSIITMGSLIHVYIAAQAAAASGARAAGATGGFGTSEMTRVVDELRGNGVDPATCSVTPSSTAVALDQQISVTVACPQHVGIPFLFTTDVSLSSTFVARGEVDR